MQNLQENTLRKNLRSLKELDDSPVNEVARAKLPTEYGVFDIIAFKRRGDGQEALALTKGEPCNNKNATIVRIHSACLTGETFFSKRCDCREQLKTAMRCIEEEGIGVIVYMFQEGRGIGIVNKIKAYALQDNGSDTVEANHKLGLKADLRRYDMAVQILIKLGIKEVRLMTNNPLKIEEISEYGIKIVERIPIVTDVHKEGLKYMDTKREKMGHLYQEIKTWDAG